MNYLWLILTAVAGYFLGAFNVAINISMHYAKKDIRQFGSGNAGTTNMLRTFGPVLGTVTFCADIAKGALSTFIGSLPGLITQDATLQLVGSMLGGLIAVVGHNWPVYYKFRGGKGVACIVGCLLMLDPILTLVLLVVAILAILLFQYVSVASMAGTFAFALIYSLAHLHQPDLYIYVIFGLIMWIMVIVSHRENIQRLRDGVEKKVDLVAIYSQKMDKRKQKKEEKNAEKTEK